jgi:hypothetical protein
MTFYYQDYKETHSGSAELFKELAGAEWTDVMRLDPEAEWEGQPPLAEREIMHFLLPHYHAYRKKHPPVCLSLGEGKGRHGVCARTSIAKGSIAVEYLGIWAGSRAARSSYKWGPIDGSSLRNYGGMVEDGFPNVGAFHLYHVDGIPLRVVFVALEDIPAGEMLTVHYGMSHSVKVFSHREYKLEQMRAFFHAHPIETCVKRIKELRSRTPRELGWRGTLELENLSAKLRYLFQTPSALLQIGSSKELAYLEQADFRYFVLNFPFAPNPRQREILSYLDLMQKADGLLDQELASKIRVRIFFTVYVQGVLAGGDSESCKTEALLWNEMFDAVSNGDQALAAFKLEQSTQRSRLIEAALLFAKEIRSPLAQWLQSLFDPLLPLAPTG